MGGVPTLAQTKGKAGGEGEEEGGDVSGMGGEDGGGGGGAGVCRPPVALPESCWAKGVGLALMGSARVLARRLLTRGTLGGKPGGGLLLGGFVRGGDAVERGRGSRRW